MIDVFQYFSAIAEELNCKICVTREKKTIMDCLEDPNIEKRLTLQKSLAKVHVLPMGHLGYQVGTVNFTFTCCFTKDGTLGIGQYYHLNFI